MLLQTKQIDTMSESNSENTQAISPKEDKPWLFKKGVSGNPGGRPKAERSLQALAKEHTLDALQTLIEIAKNPAESGAARVSAASALLDRGYGKPRQHIEHSDANIFSGMSVEELQQFIEMGLADLKDSRAAQLN